MLAKNGIIALNEGANTVELSSNCCPTDVRFGYWPILPTFSPITSRQSCFLCIKTYIWVIITLLWPIYQIVCSVCTHLYVNDQILVRSSNSHRICWPNYFYCTRLAIANFSNSFSNYFLAHYLEKNMMKKPFPAFKLFKTKIYFTK